MKKEKAMTIAYEVGNNLYLNLTNRCPCACTFCIRTMSNGAYGSDPLWLEHEPSQAEIFAALARLSLQQYNEVVFCGFGEPTMRLDVLLETAKWLKAQGVSHIRLNTNGLADLVYQKPTAPLLKGCIDVVSISLNAGTKQAYLDVTRPKFGEASFAAMQAYAKDCKAYVPSVMLTVVDILPPEELDAAKQLAKELGIGLRIRAFDSAATRREKQ